MLYPDVIIAEKSSHIRPGSSVSKHGPTTVLCVKRVASKRDILKNVYVFFFLCFWCNSHREESYMMASEEESQ